MHCFVRPTTLDKCGEKFIGAMQTPTYNADVVKIFESIGTSLTNTMYNDLYAKAVKATAQGRASNVTDMYSDMISKYYEALSRPEFANKALESLHTDYTDSFGDYISLSVFEKRVAFAFLPEKYHSSLTRAKQAIIVRNIIKEIVKKLVSRILHPKMLIRVIDEHTNAENLADMQEVAYQCCRLVREEYNSKISRAEAGLEEAETVSADIVDKISARLNNELVNRAHLEKELASAKEIIKQLAQRTKEAEAYAEKCQGDIQRLLLLISRMEQPAQPVQLMKKPAHNSQPASIAARSPVVATRSPVAPAHSPAVATRSPVAPAHSPAVAARSPAVATRSPAVAARSPVAAAAQSPIAAARSPVASRSPIVATRSPIELYGKAVPRNIPNLQSKPAAVGLRYSDISKEDSAQMMPGSLESEEAVREEMQLLEKKLEEPSDAAEPSDDINKYKESDELPPITVDDAPRRTVSSAIDTVLNGSLPEYEPDAGSVSDGDALDAEDPFFNTTPNFDDQ